MRDRSDSLSYGEIGAAYDACAARHGHTGFTLPGAERHYPPDLELAPVHLDIALKVDLEQRTAAGTVTLTVECRRSGARTLRLDGVAFEDVVVSDPDGRPLTFEYDGSELAITWSDGPAENETRRVAVGYRVVEPKAGLYFSRPSAAYPDAPSFAATDHETERARHWLACVDLPSARPKVDFHLTADSRFTILAGGALVADTHHDDGTHTAHWRLDYPCPSYLACFAIGDFVRADDGSHHGKPIAYFATPPFGPDDLKRSFGRTGAMLDWMTARLAVPYPFPKYFQFALPDFGGAMENISLVSWDDQYVLDDTLAREWTRLIDEINVHEMAHSYFGDAVVCRDYAHAWLKESWATYMEQVWFGDMVGEDERLYQYWRDAQAYFHEADNDYKRPIVTREFNSSWDMYDRHLYPGGACRLNTLRCELGDDVFWPAVTDYLQRFMGQVVETDDFRRVFEARSGRSLGKFFDQWFFSKGYPAIKVTFKHNAERGEGTFEIEQTQVDDKEGVPLFDLRTAVGWVADGHLNTREVRLAKAREVVIIPMPTAPEQVRFDPRAAILHKLDFNPGRRLLRRQLTDSADVIGRLLAGRELVKTGNRADIEAVRDAYRREPFWGVRVQLAKALGESGSEAALEALTTLVAVEDHPMVMADLMRAAGHYRNARIAAAIESRLDGGLPYRAAQAAYEALGAQRHAAPLDRLLDAAATPGYGGIAQSGALRGLASTRRTEALAFLQDHVAAGRLPSRSRPAAVTGLGHLGALQENAAREQVVESLVDLLRDPVAKVRRTALHALGAAKASEAIDALESYKSGLAHQEQVGVDHVLAALRKRAEKKAPGKGVDELAEKVRKLEDKLGKLEARLGVSDEDGVANGATQGKGTRKSGKGRRDAKVKS